MQKISLVLNIILLLAVGYLMGQHFKKPKASVTTNEVAAADQLARGEGKIAFVNIDSLDANYQFIIDSVKEIQRSENRSKRKLETSIQAAEKKSLDYQQQAAYMTQAAYEAAQKDMETEAMKIQKLEAIETEKIYKKREIAEKTYQNNLYTLLEKYNKDKDYDYIFGMSGISNILWAKDTFNITQPILEELNLDYLNLLKETSEE